MPSGIPEISTAIFFSSPGRESGLSNSDKAEVDDPACFGYGSLYDGVAGSLLVFGTRDDKAVPDRLAHGMPERIDPDIIVHKSIKIVTQVQGRAFAGQVFHSDGGNRHLFDLDVLHVEHLETVLLPLHHSLHQRIQVEQRSRV